MVARQHRWTAPRPEFGHRAGIFVLAAAWYRYGPGAPAQSIPEPAYVIYFLSLEIIVPYLITVFISIVRIAWRHRPKRFAAILTALQNELHSDAEFLTQLLTSDKLVLEYGLLQHRHCWRSFDGRIAILAVSTESSRVVLNGLMLGELPY